MKKMIMMMFALLFTMVLSANAIDETKLSFNEIKVEAPCRIISSTADTTLINIKDNDTYKLYYEIKDDILYIKPKTPINEFDYFTDDVPVIRILSEKMPIIKTSNTLTITEKTILKKNEKNNDVATKN